MDRALRIIIKALPLNIAMTLIIGIIGRNIPASILGMFIGNGLFFIYASILEWKYPR